MGELTTEIIDKLFLELAQITRARTPLELSLLRLLKQGAELMPETLAPPVNAWRQEVALFLGDD